MSTLVVYCEIIKLSLMGREATLGQHEKGVVIKLFRLWGSFLYIDGNFRGKFRSIVRSYIDLYGLVWLMCT